MHRSYTSFGTRVSISLRQLLLAQSPQRGHCGDCHRHMALQAEARSPVGGGQAAPTRPRIESELALESQERQNRERLKHVNTELADFVAAMKGAASLAQLNELWRRYNVWLLNNGVNLREGNQRILSDGNEVLRDERLEVALCDRADEMSRLVGRTDWEPR
jgi:hypothetical protein